jgi:hypothetical protein
MRMRARARAHTHTHTLSNLRRHPTNKIGVDVLLPKSHALRTEEMCMNMQQYTCHAVHHMVLECKEWLQHFLLETRKTEVSPPLEHAVAKLNNIEEALFSLALPFLSLLAKILEPCSNGALDITHPGLTALPSCPTE